MKNEKLIIEMVNKFISPDKLDNSVSIADQKGGLFNDVYRVDYYEKSYYIKQYLNQNSSGIFTPPKIEPAIRAKLAYEVHKACFALNKDVHTVPDVFIDTEQNILVIEGVNFPIVMIELITTNKIDLFHMQSIAKTIARLHAKYQNNREFINDRVFQNEEFRDFKLTLQYQNIAEELGGTYKGIITDLMERYKAQLITVLHGDLNSRNIVVNSKSNTLGIIDFEQSHVGNPIYDIAYFLCEIYISCMYFKKDQLLEDCVNTFLDTYLNHNKTFNFVDHIEELKLHLSVQIIYRFLGPSKNSWTFYIASEEDKKAIIDKAKEILLSKEEKYIDRFFNKQLSLHSKVSHIS